jgi:hypothetical protein
MYIQFQGSDTERIEAQSRQSAKPFTKTSEFGLTHPFTRRQAPSVYPPPPPPFVLGGGAHSLAGERVGGGPNLDEGADTVVL